jgi:hypothetical protein
LFNDTVGSSDYTEQSSVNNDAKRMQKKTSWPGQRLRMFCRDLSSGPPDSERKLCEREARHKLVVLFKRRLQLFRLIAHHHRNTELR